MKKIKFVNANMITEAEAEGGGFELNEPYTNLRNKALKDIFNEISNLKKEKASINIATKPEEFKSFLNKIKSININFSNGTGLNLTDADVSSQNIPDVLVEKDVAVGQTTDKNVPIEKAPVDEANKVYLTTLESWYKFLSDNKASIQKGRLVSGNKKMRGFNAPVKFADMDINDQMTVENFVSLIQQVYFKEQKVQPEKKEAPSGAGGAGVSDGWKCKKHQKVDSYDLKKPPSTLAGKELQKELTAYYKQFPDLGGSDVLKIRDCKFGNVTTGVTIKALEKVLKDTKEAKEKLIKAIQEAEQGATAQGTITKESKRLSELSKLLNEKLNNIKTNWLFEEEPKTTATTTEPVRTAVAVSTPTKQISVGGSAMTLEQAKSKLKELEGLEKETADRITVLTTSKNTGKINIADIQKTTAVFKRHNTVNPVVLIQTEKTPVSAGGGSKTGPTPPYTPPAPPPVPKTQELNCWFAFDVNVAGSPNARPIDLWNDSENSMNWESWKNLATLVFNNQKTNQTFSFITGPRAVYRSQVQLLIEREALSMNLGCFRTIFQQVYEVLATNLKSAKKAYDAYKQDQTAERDAFLKSMTDFLILSSDKKDTTYEGSNAYKLLLSLKAALNYSLQLSDGLLESAVDRLGQTKEIGKLGIKAYAVMSAEDQKKYLAQAKKEAELLKQNEGLTDRVKKLEADIIVVSQQLQSAMAQKNAAGASSKGPEAQAALPSGVTIDSKARVKEVNKNSPMSVEEFKQFVSYLDKDPKRDPSDAYQIWVNWDRYPFNRQVIVTYQDKVDGYYDAKTATRLDTPRAEADRQIANKGLSQDNPFKNRQEAEQFAKIQGEKPNNYNSFPIFYVENNKVVSVQYKNGTLTQVQESLKQRREQLLHEALFRRLVR